MCAFANMSRLPCFLCLCICCQPEKGEHDADEHFVWTNQQITRLFTCVFFPPSLSRHRVSQVVEEGHHKVFPSEQRGAIKHRQTQSKTDSRSRTFVQPLVIYTLFLIPCSGRLLPLSFKITCSITSSRSHLSIGLLK